MKNRGKIVTWLSYLIGALGGLAYYCFYSCDNGCAITSNPYLTMLFGALIFGFFIQSIHEFFFIKS
jgi:hypothetical protein